MFSRTRRIITAVTAAAVLAGGLGAAGAEQAQAAAPYKNCKIPGKWEIKHDNGWRLTTYSRSGLTYQVDGFYPGIRMYGTMELERFDVSGRQPKVEFTVVWDNDSAGSYTGTINDRGFLKGTTKDELNPGPRVGWQLVSKVKCTR